MQNQGASVEILVLLIVYNYTLKFMGYGFIPEKLERIRYEKIYNANNKIKRKIQCYTKTI